jgi:hypothetical protein
MNCIVTQIKPIMLTSGVITSTMLYSAIAPSTLAA